MDGFFNVLIFSLSLNTRHLLTGANFPIHHNTFKDVAADSRRVCCCQQIPWKVWN